LALAATAVVAATSLPNPSVAQSSNWYQHLRREGIAWLHRQLPTVPSTSDAGQALDKYKWS
jgi:hypothetical protein